MRILKFKIMNYAGMILMFFGLSGFHWFDPIAKWIGLGNENYANGKFEEAEKSYREAEKKAPDSSEIKNNLGIVEYKKQNSESALSNFGIAQSSKDASVRSQAYYNEGVIHLQSGQFEKAVNAFKNSLAANPDDVDAKVNLELAQIMLQQTTQTPQAPQTPQQQQDPENQEQTPSPQADQSQESTPEQNSEGQNSDTPTPANQTPQSTEQQSGVETPTPDQTPSNAAQTNATEQTPGTEETPTPLPEGQMSAQEAMHILDAMEEEEMDVLKRFHQLPVEERNVDKDW